MLGRQSGRYIIPEFTITAHPDLEQAHQLGVVRSYSEAERQALQHSETRNCAVTIEDGGGNVVLLVRYGHVWVKGVVTSGTVSTPQ